MVDFEQKEHYTAQDLVRIVSLLRDPVNGCPWDKEQTHQSIRSNFIEETYEALEAIDLNDAHLLEEELGDVLLQVALHCQMEAEKGVFDFDSVCDGICKKLIYRHPHVFGDTVAETTGEVLSNWEALKNAEKARHRQEPAGERARGLSRADAGGQGAKARRGLRLCLPGRRRRAGRSGKRAGRTERGHGLGRGR